MNSQDLKIAGKVAKLVSRFSAEWLEYQDWLRDIISSSVVLQQRHPGWLAVIIFRWRLLYFVAYVGTVMVVNRLFKKLMSFHFTILSNIGLSWTAIVLNWGQTSFWRFKIELGIVASIPLVGSTIRNILSGGNGIDSITLQHMYALHSYILVIVAVFLSLTHLTALIYQEQNWKSEDKQFRFMQLCKSFAKDSSSI